MQGIKAKMTLETRKEQIYQSNQEVKEDMGNILRFIMK